MWKQMVVTVFTVGMLLLISATSVLAIGGGGNNPPWGGPMPPMCCFCDVNGTMYWEGVNPYLDNVIPELHSWEEVDITGKGVLTCVNLTLPSGCTANVSFQWLNWSLYFDLWLTWAYAQDWDDWPGGIDSESEPYYDNDSFWFNYSSWTGINQSTQLCEYAENVSCYTENNWASNRFDWRVNLDITCANSTYNATCYYCFRPESCPLSYIWPPSPNGTACPCCEAMCVRVTNDLGHPMNVTIYGQEAADCDYWHIWNSYTNITNGTYCYCMDAICPSQRTHTVVHSHTNHTVAIADTWYNITYDHGHAIRMKIAADMKSITFLEHGHYTITYWAATQSDEVNPNGDIVAVRIYNDAELRGSYRELAFSNKGRDRNIVGFVHDEFFVGETIKFQYISDDTDSVIRTSGTFSNDFLCFYAYIVKTGMEEINPLQYNTTYRWYVNITDMVTGESEVSSIFQFRTAEHIEDCPCGESDTHRGEIVLFNQGDIGILGFVFGIIALILCIVFLFGRRRTIKDEKEEE